MNKKPRSDAKLLNLPEDQAAQLRDLLFDGTSYGEAIEFVQDNFAVTTSSAAMCHFWKNQCVPRLAERRQGSIRTAAELAASGRDSAAPFDEAAQGVIQQRIFELCLTPAPDAAELKTLSDILHRNRSLALAESRLDIARARALLEERRVSSLEADASQIRGIKQAEVDRDEKHRREWGGIFDFLKPRPDRPASPAPQPGETKPNTESTPGSNP